MGGREAVVIGGEGREKCQAYKKRDGRQRAWNIAGHKAGGESRVREADVGGIPYTKIASQMFPSDEGREREKVVYCGGIFLSLPARGGNSCKVSGRNKAMLGETTMNSGQNYTYRE